MALDSQEELNYTYCSLFFKQEFDSDLQTEGIKKYLRTMEYQIIELGRCNLSTYLSYLSRREPYESLLRMVRR